MEERKAIYFDGFVMDVLQDRKDDWNEEAYPFFLTAVRTWEKLELHEKVTFLVGENGTGKSTLVEAIAISAGFNAEGGSRNLGFSTAQAHSNLYEHLRLSKSPRKIRDGFFLRAESYFNVATQIDKLDSEPGGPPIINSYGGTSLHKMSHGESFMALLEERFGGNGFYVLDEPEAALSPQRQFAFLTRLHELVEEGSQFVIATHSPILLAYPNAWIYEMTEQGPSKTVWDALDHVDQTRQFLNHKDTFISALLDEDE